MGIFEDLDEWADPRSKDWFLVMSLPKILAIVAIYLVFCKIIGPAFMKNRKAFILDRFIQIYNVIQIILCTYYAIQVAIAAVHLKYTFVCDPVIRGTDYASLRGLQLHWMYLLIKFIDFTDTIIFVLRKKFNQISNLHIYHHFSMLLVSWITMRYYPGGQLVLTGILNSIVHTCMYIYYFIASLGPEYKKYLWWKKHITHIQLVQFIILGVHSLGPFVRECDYPKPIALMITAQSSIFIYLFGKFYVNTYIKKADTNKSKTK